MANRFRLLFLAIAVLVTWAVVSLIPVLLLGLRSAKCDTTLDIGAVLTDLRDGAFSRMNQALATIVSTARLAALITPELRDCALENQTQATFDPYPLLTLNFASEAGLLQGVGVITAPINASTGEVDASNKVSFEVTDGSIVKPACPGYLYGFTTAAPGYESYCIADSGAVDYSQVRYSGPDYGLAPEEVDLIEGRTSADFLPVFNLVGRQSLTYELAWRCNSVTARQAYGISFAQTNLLLLSAYFQSMAQDGVIYVVERASGLLVASNVPDQTVTIDPASGSQVRVSAANASNKAIQEIADALGPLSSFSSGEYISKNYAILAQRYEYAPADSPLGWILVVAAERDGLVQTVKRVSSRSDVVIPVVTGLLCLIMLKFVFDAIEVKFGRRRSESVQQLTAQSHSL